MEQMTVSTIRKLVSDIDAVDLLESQHRQSTLEWIDSGVQLFRISKPDNPKKHLVVYFALVDRTKRKILLVDHKKAGLWLPPGGHVEVNEHPSVTVARECMEELGIQPELIQEAPLFLTVTTTVGNVARHEDVTLWYVLEGDETTQLQYDTEEFNSVDWFDIEAIPGDATDPHMARFIEKVKPLCV